MTLKIPEFPPKHFWGVWQVSTLLKNFRHTHLLLVSNVLHNFLYLFTLVNPPSKLKIIYIKHKPTVGQPNLNQSFKGLSRWDPQLLQRATSPSTKWLLWIPLPRHSGGPFPASPQPSGEKTPSGLKSPGGRETVRPFKTFSQLSKYKLIVRLRGSASAAFRAPRLLLRCSSVKLTFG